MSLKVGTIPQEHFVSTKDKSENEVERDVEVPRKEVLHSPRNTRNHQESSVFGFTNKKWEGGKVIHEKPPNKSSHHTNKDTRYAHAEKDK